MMNDKQTPTEFLASLEQYREEMLYQIRLKRKVLREGIDVSDKEGYDAIYQEEYLNEVDDDQDARFNELIASGLSRDKAMRALLSEGYGMRARAAELRKAAELRNDGSTKAQIEAQIAAQLRREGYGVGVDE